MAWLEIPRSPRDGRLTIEIPDADWGGAFGRLAAVIIPQAIDRSHPAIRRAGCMGVAQRSGAPPSLVALHSALHEIGEASYGVESCGLADRAHRRGSRHPDYRLNEAEVVANDRAMAFLHRGLAGLGIDCNLNEGGSLIIQKSSADKIFK